MNASERHNDEPVDVLIIGAGASGAAFAWSMAETKMRIVCLDQGGWPDPAAFPSNFADWEERRTQEGHISPNVRRAASDYPVNDDASPIKVVNWNGVGGGTVLYAAHFPRLHPSDFRVKSLDGVADDWPISYDELRPFFEENDRMMGVAGVSGDPAYPPDNAERMPPVPLGRSGRRLAEGFNRLGWHWWPSSVALATEERDGRPPCINLGACLWGCAQGAKSSTDVTYWPVAQRSGVELRTHCRVREIEVGEDGMATGVVYFDADGLERRQRAHVVVMAANGVGTARLLLNSKSKLFPDGLANSSGEVGRNLMFHPYSFTEGVFEEPLDGGRGPMKSVWSHEFYETDEARGFVRGYMFEATRGHPPATTALSGFDWGVLPWGEGHHDAFRRLHDRIVGFAGICEDLPEAHNRVTLDPDLTDAHGIPAPKIDYTLSENSKAMLAHSTAKATEVLKAAGAVEVFATNRPYSGWHLLGTARMGEDPARSVVNNWGRAHDVKNLFIVDGSVFVTSGGCNPTSTIQAIALYVADQMKRRLANLFD